MILTSYFANKSIWDAGLRLVAVSLSVPRGFYCERYPALAPSRALINLAHEGRFDEYTRLYVEQVLSRLDPLKVYRELDGSILLCWEKAGKFCHRRLIADWLAKDTGYDVKEFGHDTD